jgi:hypothetical protein
LKHQRNCWLVVFLVFNTLLKAQENDSIRSRQFSKSLGIVEMTIPAAMIAYGVIAAGSDWLNGVDCSFRHDVINNKSAWFDDFIPFAPAVAAFSMDLCGVESVHRLPDMFVIYLLSNALESGIVFTMKNVTSRARPDGSNYDSFPSGHTSTAFLAAEFLHQEYGCKSVWISICGYGTATLTGISRIYNNRHWTSDVIAGAGIGIMSAKLVYLIYPWLRETFCRKDKAPKTLVFPAYANGNFSLNMSYGF